MWRFKKQSVQIAGLGNFLGIIFRLLGDKKPNQNEAYNSDIWGFYAVVWCNMLSIVYGSE